ncbi:MAG: BACON domain-containing protein [Paludibacteraceae bacterium]|nr:BACON domain-containing protein [Paludibacteraceae bacterium]
MKYIVLLVLSICCVGLSYGQNTFVQDVEKAIDAMSQARNMSELKEKYEIAGQKVNAFRGRLGKSAQESVVEENKLSKKINETYYKLFTDRIETYFKSAGEWKNEKILEFESNLSYVDNSTIKTGYVENPKKINDIKSAIKGYKEYEKYIKKTNAKLANASLEERRKIKNEATNKMLDMLQYPYLSLHSGVKEGFNNIKEQCDVFEVSKDSLNFSYEGGIEYISVRSVSDWNLENISSSMLEISREGDDIIVVCARNDGGDRSDWFEIKSGSKSIRVEIKQTEASNQEETESNQSDEMATHTVEFDSNGGQQVLTVVGNESWELLNTSSAMMSVSKSDDREIKIYCYENTGGAREDWFVVKIGNRKTKVIVSQRAVIRNTSFSLSRTTLSFSSEEETKYITVNGNAEWHLESYASSMMTVSRLGKSIEVKCPKNTGGYRTDWFNVVSGDKKIKVTVSQSASESSQAPKQFFSSNALSFPSEGGTKYIEVYGNESWQIENNYSPNNIFTATKEGNRVKVVCNRNNTNRSREDWFTIEHGGMYDKVNIIQSATSNMNDDFTLSSSLVSIAPSGGTEYITVNGKSNWYISGIPSWTKVKRVGNSIKIECKRNKDSYRTDWFDVVCGNQRKRVTIAQNVDNTCGRKYRDDDSYRTLILGIGGYSLASQPSAGLLIGGFRSSGWYIKGRTGFAFASNKHICNDEQTDDNYVDDYYRDYYDLLGINEDGYFLTGETEKTDLSVTAGIIFRFGSSPVCFNVGAGYENRKVLQKTMNGEWIKNKSCSYDGFVGETSFLFLIRRVSVFTGVSTIIKFYDVGTEKETVKFDYTNFEFGLGVNF